MNNSLKLTALTLGMAFAASSMAADLTVVSFGGANKNAQVKAFYSPWEAAGHGKVIAGEYNGEMAKVKAMVDTQSVSCTWSKSSRRSWPVAVTKACSKPSIRRSSATPMTSFRAPFSRAAWASSCGRPCSLTTPTS